MDRRGAVQHAEKLSERRIAHLVIDAHDLVARQLVAAFQERAALLGVVAVDFEMTANQRIADRQRDELGHRHAVAMPFHGAIGRIHEGDGGADDRQRIGLEARSHHVAQPLQAQLVVDELADLGNEAIGAGDEGEVEMLVNRVAGLQLQRRILDRREQRRIVAVTVLGDAEL